MSPSGRRALRTLVWSAAFAASAAAGWVARGAAVAPLRSAAGVLAPASAAAVASPRTRVAAEGLAAPQFGQRTADGMVGRMVPQPGQRTMPALVAAAAALAAGPPNGALPQPGCAPAAANADALLHTIAQGGDEDRAEALLRARIAGVPVPDALLRELIETSPSDRVRLAAMELWLEARAGDPDAERAALAALIFVSNAAVQHDLRRRVVELDAIDRIEALAVHGVAQRP